MATGDGPTPRRGGRASDHLANERTFLAWVRTSLGLIGLGFVLARMGLFLERLAWLGGADHAADHPGEGHPFVVAGVVFLVLGTAQAGWSGWLYHRVRRDIDAERYEPAWRSVFALTALIVLGGLAIVAIVLHGLLLAAPASP
jgi:putative membrane protein